MRSNQSFCLYIVKNLIHLILNTLLQKVMGIYQGQVFITCITLLRRNKSEGERYRTDANTCRGRILTRKVLVFTKGAGLAKRFCSAVCQP